jgi:hypothetical protein
MVGKCSTFMYLFLCTTLGHWGITVSVSKSKYGALKHGSWIHAIFLIFSHHGRWRDVNFLKNLYLSLKRGGTDFFSMEEYWKLTEIKNEEVLRRPRRVLILIRKRHKEWGAPDEYYETDNSIDLNLLHNLLILPRYSSCVSCAIPSTLNKMITIENGKILKIDWDKKWRSST